MDAYDTIRAAIDHYDADVCAKAIAALAELERAAAEPVAWMWEDMIGISHTYVSPKRPTWPDAGASPEMVVAINVRPLYTTPPPAPVAPGMFTAEEMKEACEEAYEKGHDDGYRAAYG